MPKKVKQGVVISDKMDKTIVVKVASYNPHPKYKKIIETNKKLPVSTPKILSKNTKCPLDETGKNSVNPWTKPSTTKYRISIV